MKQLIIAFLLVLSISASSCFRELDYTFNETKKVELEDAVRRTPAAGVTFPVISVTRTSGAQILMANLVGEQFKTSQEMSFSIDTAVTSLLNATTIRAEAGVHFNLNGGKFTFKQDTSFSPIKVDIVNSPAQAGKFAVFVLKLDGNTEVLPSENYRRVGFRIDLK
jgi:hypothetical protein